MIKIRFLLVLFCVGVLGILTYLSTFLGWFNWDQYVSPSSYTPKIVKENKKNFSKTTEVTILEKLYGLDTFAFDVSFSTSISFQDVDEGVVNSEQKYFDVSLSSHLLMDVDLEDDKAIAYFKLDKVALDFSDEENMSDPLVIDSFKEKLNIPFAISISLDGRFKEIYLSKEEELMSAGFKKAIVSRLQYVDSTGDIRWQSEESNESGKYLAEYSRDSDFTTKKILSFVELSRDKGKKAIHSIREQESKLKFSFQTDGKMELVDANSMIASDVEDFDLHSRVVSKTYVKRDEISKENIKFDILSGYIASALYINLIQGEAVVENKAFSPDEFIDSEQFMEKISDISPELEWNELWKYREQFYHSIIHDASAMDGLENILKKDINDINVALLLGALTDTESPEAQLKLIEISQNPEIPLSIREHAVSHLGLFKQPTEENIDYLSSVIDDYALPVTFRETAILALGSSAGAGVNNSEFQGGDVKVFQDTVSKLEAAYLNADNVDERNIYLLSLGNAGNQSSESVLLDLANSTSPSDRALAVDSLRFHNSPEVNQSVVGIIRSDSDSNVQVKAINSTVYRQQNQDIDDALLQVARTSANEGVRLAAYAALDFRAGDSDAVLNQFALASQSDQSPEVREFVDSLLEARSPSDNDTFEQGDEQGEDIQQDTEYSAAFDELEPSDDNSEEL